MAISGSWNVVCRPAVTLCAALSMLVSSVSAAQAGAQAGPPLSPGGTQGFAVRGICAESIEDQAVERASRPPPVRPWGFSTPSAATST